MTLIGLLSAALTVSLLPVFGLLLVVTAAALVAPARRARPAAGNGAPRFLFVIPAHDEETTIRRTVESCRAVAYDPDRFAVRVIADNCTDRTSAIARAAGAEVVERVDPLRRSKGYALEDFFAGGAVDGYDAAVVVDADSVVDPNLLDEFAAGLAAGYDWLQCYDTVSNPDASWRTRLMTYAFSLINGVWLLGQERLGLGASLRGNGMCLTARGLARIPWRASGLAEDLEFSWRLRVAGERIGFVPGACVRAEMLTGGDQAATSQRRRWEAGRRDLRARVVGPLLRSGRIGWIRKGAYLVDLGFPSLVGLALALALAASIHPAATLDPRLAPLARVLLPVHAAMAAVLGAYALSPIVVMRLPARYLRSLGALPYYAAWKLAATLGRRPTAWVRTRREPARGGGGS